MGSSGGGSSSSGKTEVRYAPYIESKHESFLTTLQTYRVSAVSTSPFDGYEDVEVDDAFFGVGFLLTSYPALYDMYGKFMAGLDIEVLYTQLFEDTINASVVNNLVAAEGALLDDEININSLPRLQTGMRDINSIMSSSFVIGKTLLEDTKTKAIGKFSAELKYRLLPMVQDRWAKHLEWNGNVVNVYAELLKFYYSAKIDINEMNYEYAEKIKLWPFTILEFERAGLGALQAAQNTKTDIPKPPAMAKVLGGAMSGAAMGAMMTKNPYGIAIGAAIGGLAGIFM